jgi:hypothetical protein
MMDLVSIISLSCALLLAASCWSFPMMLIPGYFLILGMFTGDIRYEIFSLKFSPLGVFFYISLALIIIKHRHYIKRIDVKNNIKDKLKTTELKLILTTYLLSSILPGLYFFLIWGELPINYVKLNIIPIYAFLFLCIDYENLDHEKYRRIILFFFISVVIVSLPQSVYFFIVTGGRGLGRFRAYRIGEKIIDMLMLQKVGMKHYWFQINLVLSFYIIVFLSAVYSRLVSDFIKRLKWGGARLFFGGFFLMFYFTINQYTKLIIYNGLLLILLGGVSFFFYTKRKWSIRHFLVVSLGIIVVYLPISFDREISQFVKKTFDQKRTIMDEESPFFIMNQFSTLKLEASGVYGKNRIDLYSEAIRNWSSLCFLKGCGGREIQKKNSSGKLEYIRTLSGHSSFVDDLTTYGAVFGLISNSFVILIFLIPFIFKWYKSLTLVQLLFSWGTLLSFSTLSLIDDFWWQVHFRFICLGSLLLLYMLKEKNKLLTNS